MACVHVQTSFPHELFVVPADAEWPVQAWCGICEEARLGDQGWYDNADAVAQWGWACHHCLQDTVARATHTTVVDGPALGTPDQRPQD